PAVRAVVRVVVDECRSPGEPVEPVVEHPHAEQEPERRGDHPADEDDVLPVVRRVPAGERPDADDDVHPDQEEQRRDPERPEVARPHEDAAPPRRRMAVLGLGAVLDGRGHLASFPLRNATSASNSSGESVLPKVVGITPDWNPDTTTALGSTIDCLMYASSGSPAFFASATRPSRSGPIWASVPAGAKAWQPP